MGSHSLLQVIFLTQGSNLNLLCLLHWHVGSSPLVPPGASLIVQLVKNPPAMQETRFDSWVRMICWRRDRLPTPVSLGFPGGSAGEESVCSVGDLGLIPGLGRSPGEGKGYPLQYSGLENSMNYIVHGVTKSQTQLSDFHFTLVPPGKPII